VAFVDVVDALPALQSYWRLGEASGPAVDRKSGRDGAASANGLTRGAATLLSDGSSDAATTFDGAQGYFEVPYAAALDGQSLSVGAWLAVQNVARQGTYRALISNRDATGPQGWILYASDTNIFEWWIATSAGWSFCQGPAFTLGARYFLLATWDGASRVQKLYVNGTLASTVTPAAGVTHTVNASRPLRLGAGANESASPQFYFPGQLDEAFVAAQVLSDQQAADLFAAGTTPPAASSGVSIPASAARRPPALTVLVDGRRVEATSPSFSSVDPGGFETCTFALKSGAAPRPGAEVRVFAGLETAWHGFVEEPGQRHERYRQSASVTAVGQGGALKRNPYREIYLDRALGRWQQASTRRQVALASGYTLSGPSVEPDPLTGTPSVKVQCEGPWTTLLPLSEAWYDAGPTARIARLLADWKGDPNTMDANWQIQAVLSDFDTHGLLPGDYTATGDLWPGGAVTSGSIDLARPGARFADLQVQHTVLNGGTNGLSYTARWSNIRVLGTHGLALRAAGGTDGLWCSDVALDAVKRSGAGFELGDVRDASGYLLPHLVYEQRTTPEQVVTDMARLLGWHWGVWEPSPLGSVPRFFFCPPPEEATAIVDYADCEGLDLTEQLSAMHDQAIVAFTDPAQGAGEQLVTRPHPRLPEGIHQQLLLDAGTSTAAAAAAIAATQLALDQAQARVAGSCTLPPFVMTAAGALRPSILLRPGRDRIRVLGLPTTGSLVDDQAARVDTFRIRRLSVSSDGRGVPTAQVEFDAGADLIETLQARLAVAAALAGG
jgi:hypothetical protein